MIRQRAFLAFVLASAVAGCDENAVQDITVPASGARVKFHNFGVNAPAVNFYANDTKVTAISSTTGSESTNGVAYGAAAAGGFYSQLPAGQYALSGRIAATVDKNLPISTVTATLEDNKNYTFFMSGIYNTTSKTVEGFVIEDVLPATINPALAYVRFVNAISNAAPLTLFAKNTTTTTETAVGGSIAYKGSGEFVTVEGGTYDLGARLAGVTTNAFSRTGVVFTAGRVYTVTSRGDITVTSTTATNRPSLDNTISR